MVTKKINIGSAQINNGFSGQFYLPYSIGILQAFVEHNSKRKEAYDFQSTIYKRLLLDDAFEKLKNCDIALFSTYVWNSNISLAIAKKLKKFNKKIFIVVGGPSVPDNIGGKSEKFLRDNNFIDVIIHQEGERTTLQLLDEFPNNDLENTPNVSFINKKNLYINNANLPRMKDFTHAPSPYLTGVFDKILEENPNERWLASWETNRGCPFSCAFCDWGSATNSKVSRMDLGRVFAEMDWFSQNKIEFIFCCDANFGMLPRDFEIAQKAAENKKKYGYPHVLSVQNTKNSRERAYKVQKLLADEGLSKGVTLAMQSVDPHTLKTIKRDNISIADYSELQRKFSKDKIPTYTEFILGLPGDTYEVFANGVSQVIAAGQHNRIQYNNLSILPNAEMASPSYMEEHAIITSENPIVNAHGTLDEMPEDGIYEVQNMVVGTKSLPQDKWIDTRAYASMSEFLYFNKVLQIPLLIIHKLSGASFRDLFETFMKNDLNLKVIEGIKKNFIIHAQKIIDGRPEFVYHKGWLDIHWPPGELELIRLVEDNKIEEFYDESLFLLNSKFSNSINSEVIKEAVKLNFNLLRLPNKKTNSIYSTKYNIYEVYKDFINNDSTNLRKENEELMIIREDKKFDTFSEWLQKIIWYGHRSGAYLCNAEKVNSIEFKEKPFEDQIQAK
tara:strand:- start:176 stop:2185 length:2010 start_codon:yes stop_codon:yes gene_type:complete